jgi:hypothetical protein
MTALKATLVEVVRSLTPAPDAPGDPRAEKAAD